MKTPCPPLLTIANKKININKDWEFSWASKVLWFCHCYWGHRPKERASTWWDNLCRLPWEEGTELQLHETGPRDPGLSLVGVCWLRDSFLPARLHSLHSSSHPLLALWVGQSEWLSLAGMGRRPLGPWLILIVSWWCNWNPCVRVEWWPFLPSAQPLLGPPVTSVWVGLWIRDIHCSMRTVHSNYALFSLLALKETTKWVLLIPSLQWHKEGHDHHTAHLLPSVTFNTNTY